MDFKLRYLLFLFLFPITLLAEETISVYPQQGVLRFKGLDDTSSLLTVQDERASDLQNVKLSLSNSLRKRKGIDRIGDRINELIDGDFFPAVTGLYYTKLSTGTEFILSTAGRRAYSLVTGDWVDITDARTQTITSAQTNQYTWGVGLDTIIFTNDIHPPITYIVTVRIAFVDAIDLSDTLTKAKTLAWFKNYLIFGNTVENSIERPTRFRWSNVGTVETFSDDDFIDIAALGGQEINGLIELYDNLYILMTDSIWKASLVGGDEIFVISKVVDNIGCIAKNSIQSINLFNQRKGIVFLSKDKRIYFFDGTTLIDLSTLITGVMGDLRADRLQYAVSSETGKSYFLSVTTGNSNTSNNLLLDFQYELGEWTKHIQIDANTMAKVVDPDSLSQVYYGNYDSFVYVVDTLLNNDITGQTDGVASIGKFNTATGLTNTATGLTMIITDNPIDYSATGAIVTITAGTGTGQERVIVQHTSTGLIVDSDFSTEPDSSSSFSIGAIDAFYETKWYDFGEPARIKNIADLYIWVEESSNSNVSIEESLDFTSVLLTKTISLQGTGGIWGVALWGIDVWGGEEALFKKANLAGQGRFLKLKFSNSAIDQTFNLLGFVPTYFREDIQ